MDILLDNELPVMKLYTEVENIQFLIFFMYDLVFILF